MTLEEKVGQLVQADIASVTPDDLRTYPLGSILAGYVDERGERRSLFEPLADGTPRLVAALLARHDESGLTPRGMPLGLPPLSAEDIQLVESWVAQGKPL